MTVEQWLRMATGRLQAAGDMDARFDAECMAMDMLSIDRARLRLHYATPLDAQMLDRLGEWLCRRVSGEPLQYIEGFAYFMGFRFAVDARVLIPRQDTEILCELALNEVKNFCAPEVLDLCTGSGAVGISIAKLCRDARVTATDISDGALAVARGNARELKACVEFLEGDLFSAVPGRMFDMIVCNPPYLTRKDMGELQREVQYEPETALAGGEDGLDFYRRIAEGLPHALRVGGCAMLEVGHTQAGQVAEMLLHVVPRAEICRERDLCGVERVVVLHHNVKPA